jgi:hypothetical protein
MAAAAAHGGLTNGNALPNPRLFIWKGGDFCSYCEAVSEVNASVFANKHVQKNVPRI